MPQISSIPKAHNTLAIKTKQLNFSAEMSQIYPKVPNAFNKL